MLPEPSFPLCSNSRILCTGQINAATLWDCTAVVLVLLVEESKQMADPSYPCRVRTYQNHFLDSTRWDRFLPRRDDVLISTSYKSGTTWMQRIVSLLVFGSGPLPAPLSHLSPWVD